MSQYPPNDPPPPPGYGYNQGQQQPGYPEQNPYAYGPAGAGQPGYDPYGYPPPKKSGSKILIIILCIVGGLFLCCCGGGGGLIWFTGSVLEQETVESLTNNPEFESRFGTIQSADWQITASGERNDGAIVLNVEGSKGSGTVLLYNQGPNVIIELENPDGTTVELYNGPSHSQ